MKKLTTHILMTLLLLMVWQGDLMARKITLTKTGGDATIYTTNPTIQPLGATFNSTTTSQTITYDESSIGNILNWTDYFNYFSACINFDSENDNISVEYLITITSTDSTTPMIIGNQYINANWEIKSKELIFLNGGQAIMAQTNAVTTPIHKVTINGVDANGNDAKGYLKYIDGFKYGSYLKFSNSPAYANFSYYHVQMYDTNNVLTYEYYCTFYPPANNPPSVIVTHPSYTSPISNTNPPTLASPFPTLNTVANGNWQNVSIGTSEIRVANMSDFIYAYLSDNVSINNIIINGNATHADTNFTMYGDKGKQLAHSGIVFTQCKNNKASHCEVIDFALDGIQINGQCENIFIDDCKYDYCGRNGISWLGGKNLIANNTYCRYTGKGGFASSPGAGMDIENEQGHGANAHPIPNTNPVQYSACYDNYDFYKIEHGTFTNCFFQYNTGNEVENYSGCEGYAQLIDDIKFNNCTFDKSPTNLYGIWCQGMGFEFNNCNINATVKNAYSGLIAGKETTFNGCHFKDKTSDGSYWANGHKMAEIDSKVIFHNCDFEIAHSNAHFMQLFTGLGEPSIIDNCLFDYHINELEVESYAQNTHFGNVKFRNKNTFKNSLNTSNSKSLTYLTNCTLEGSNDACNPSEIIGEGQTQLYIEIGGAPGLNHDEFKMGKKQNGTTDGYANLILKNASLLTINPNENIEVNKNSSIIIDSNASLFCVSADPNNGVPLINDFVYFNLMGKLIAKHKSFIQMQNAYISSNIITNSMFYIADLCNTNNMSLSNIWGGGFLQNWKGNYPTPYIAGQLVTCIEGGHSSFSTNQCNIPPFANIANSNSKTLLYNKTDVACGGGNTGSINFKEEAGMTYTMNGNVIASPLQNLAGGGYNIQVTDASGCSAVFNINIGPTTAQCCNTALVNNTNTILINNGLSSSLGTNLIGKTFFVDGTLTINDDVTFDDCDFYFTAGSQIIVQAGKQLTIKNGSTLQRACGDYWKGIIVDDATAEIMIDNSTLQDMSEGVQAKNNATIQATDNTFKNNANTSIGFENMTLQTNSQVWKNTFTSDASMIAIAGQTLPKHGVEIVNSDFVTIGHETIVANGNTFTNLYNGIKVFGDNTIAGSGNTIELYNNKFEDITTPLYETITIPNSPNCFVKPIDIYASDRGSAVYIDYTQAINFSGKTIVKNTTQANVANLPKILNCSKGIVSLESDVETDHLKLVNTHFGLMNYALTNKKYKIRNSHISGTHLGLQTIGMIDELEIMNNDIEASNEGVDEMTLCGGAYPPTAIDIKNYIALPNSNTHHIAGNVLSNSNTAGVGISLQGATNDYVVGGNEIKFTTQSIPNAGFATDNGLVGIQINYCDGITLQDNLIYGSSSQPVFDSKFSKGMLFEESKNSVIKCNKIKYTKQGLYAYGDNTTASGNITDNKFKFNRNPLFAFDNVLPGTFGTIGDGSTENGNNWLYNTTNTSWLQQPGNKKIWRQSNVQITDVIRTNASLLIQSESGSPLGIGDYVVPPITLPPYVDNVCPDPLFIIGHHDDIEVDYNGDLSLEALEVIANQELDYLNHYDVAEWMTNSYLYEQLDRNESMRNSSVALQNFYSSYQNSNIDRIQKADMAFAVMGEHGSNIEYLNNYTQAMQQANSLLNPSEWEKNERDMNVLALKMMQEGISSVTQADKTLLEFLAKSCPYEQGKAVFKARSIWALFEPATQYNDRLKCMPQAQNKSSNGATNSSNNIDSLLESQVNEEAVKLYEYTNFIAQKDSVKGLVNLIQVYPNPTKDYLYISYPTNIESQLIIYNQLGEIVLQQNIFSSEKINLQNITNGIYHIKLIQNNEIFNAKLTIKK